MNNELLSRDLSDLVGRIRRGDAAALRDLAARVRELEAELTAESARWSALAKEVRERAERAARREALEEAAAVCEDLYTQITGNFVAPTAIDCAAAIRALRMERYCAPCEGIKPHAPDGSCAVCGTFQR